MFKQVTGLIRFLALRGWRSCAALLLGLALCAPALAQVTLAWDASTSPGVTGYYLHYGTASRSYSSRIGVGNATSHTVPNLNAGQTYFFAVTSHDASLAESPHSNEVSTTIGVAATTTTLASAPNPSVVGANVAITAVVTGSAPTGSVVFRAGGSTIGGCAAVALSGSGNTRTAVCTTSSLAAGTHAITANYSGNAGNAASTSAVLSQVVSTGVAATTTTLASAPNPSVVGANVAITAAVTGSAPTGSVVFRAGGSTIGGCAAVALSGSGNTRTAVCTTSSLAAGTHALTANYSGNAGNAASTSAALSQVVSTGVAATTTTLASAPNPSVVGANVAITAAVTGSAPTGSVVFRAGGSTIGGCAAVALSGSGNTRTAVCTTSSLAAGTHALTAGYAGNAGNAASSSAVLSQVVSTGVAATTTTLASAPNPSVVGANVAITAAVTGSAPTGSVAFRDGVSTIGGCAAVALSGSGNTRTAVCTTSSLAAGTHAITASYSGNASNAASTSAVLSQVVSIAVGATTTTLASAPNPSVVGASVAITAAVTGSAPTGSVAFRAGVSTIGGCAAVALSGSGNTRTAVCTTSSLAAGTHAITASYSGNASNAASTSAVLSQIVNPTAAPATFADVPNDHWAFAAIEALVYNGITLGCASVPRQFCPDSLMSRAEMALFIERTLRGSGFVYSPTGTRFADVPMVHWAVGPIEQLSLDGITSGCASAPMRFCPTNIVTRATMAKFLLRAKLGPGYDPGMASGTVFVDVPMTHAFAAWVEAFYGMGYTGGCASNPLRFCPDALLTRAEAAVFLYRVFDLPDPP